MKAVADTLGVARSNLAAPCGSAHARGRPPQPEAALLAEIKAIIAGMPTPAFAGAGSTAIAACTPCFGAAASRMVVRQ